MTTEANAVNEEIVREEYDTAFPDTFAIGMTHSDASKMLPHVITPSGIVKKVPGFTRGRSFEAVIRYGSMVAATTKALEQNDHAQIALFTPAGILLLSQEMTHYLDVNEMWIDLASKGWTFKPVSFVGS